MALLAAVQPSASRQRLAPLDLRLPRSTFGSTSRFVPMSASAARSVLERGVAPVTPLREFGVQRVILHPTSTGMRKPLASIRETLPMCSAQAHKIANEANRYAASASRPAKAVADPIEAFARQSPASVQLPSLLSSSARRAADAPPPASSPPPPDLAVEATPCPRAPAPQQRQLRRPPSNRPTLRPDEQARSSPATPLLPGPDGEAAPTAQPRPSSAPPPAVDSAPLASQSRGEAAAGAREAERATSAPPTRALATSFELFTAIENETSQPVARCWGPDPKTLERVMERASKLCRRRREQRRERRMIMTYRTEALGGPIPESPCESRFPSFTTESRFPSFTT